ncbi:MAG: hypothetical protein PUQ00_14915 [Nostoc sp. S13]|nr:hypothetical protein [Nostoc sp. S13]
MATCHPTRVLLPGNMQLLSNRIQESVARIHLGILCDWWMNKRRLRPPQNKKIWWSTFVVAGLNPPLIAF